MQGIIIIIIEALGIFYRILSYSIFGICIVSWLPISRDNPIVRALQAITDPILSPIRRLIARSPLGDAMIIDFSPIIAYLLLFLIFSSLTSFLSSLLY